jgi:hypothetical protein
MDNKTQKAKLMFSKLKNDMMEKNEALEKNINKILRMLSKENINRYLRILTDLPPEQKKEILKSMCKFTNARKSYDENLENINLFKENKWKLCDYKDLLQIDKEMDDLLRDTKTDIKNIYSVYNKIAAARSIDEFADDDFKDDDKKDWRQLVLDEIEKLKLQKDRQNLLDEIVSRTTIKESDAIGVNEAIKMFNEKTGGRMPKIGAVAGGEALNLIPKSFVNNSIGTIAAFAYNNPKMFSAALIGFAPPMAPFIPYINTTISTAKSLGISSKAISSIVTEGLNLLSKTNNPGDFVKFIEIKLNELMPKSTLSGVGQQFQTLAMQPNAMNGLQPQNWSIPNGKMVYKM